MKEFDLKRLAEPFAADDIEWRVQSSGLSGSRVWAIVIPYISARAIFDRLDEVVGPEAWRNAFRPGPAGGVLAGIGIRIDGTWVWKWDGAENTKTEAIKGGLSGALKRAGVLWGIGRYLYRLEATFATIFGPDEQRGIYRDRLKVDGRKDVRFRWNPPELPAWALPGGTGHPPKEERRPGAPLRDNGAEPADEESAESQAARDELSRAVEAARTDAIWLALSEEQRMHVENAAALASDAEAPLERMLKAVAWLGGLGSLAEERQKLITAFCAMLTTAEWTPEMRKRFQAAHGVQSLTRATTDQVRTLVAKWQAEHTPAGR